MAVSQQKPVGRVTPETEKPSQTQQLATTEHSTPHHHTTMAFRPTQSNLPLSRTDEIAAKLKTLLPQPPLVTEKKWNEFMDSGVLLFSLFLEAHPDQVVSVGAYSRELFDTGSRFATNIHQHQVTGELVDGNIYDYERYGHDNDKQIAELFRDEGETIRVCENTLAHAHRLTSDPWQSCAQKAQHHAHKKANLFSTPSPHVLTSTSSRSARRSARGRTFTMRSGG
jgi:hypothetical protein